MGRLLVAMAGINQLLPNLIGMTGNRRWQVFWCVTSVIAAMLLMWLSSKDPGVLSRKFF